MTTLQQKSVLEYQKRIQKVLAYIMENLDRPLSLKEVARAASFSEYHFHRIFSAFMKESPAAYITRKKLEKAAVKLAYSPNATVSQVAFEFGYASVSGFSKAFNQCFGYRPSEITRARLNPGFQEGKVPCAHGSSVETERLFVGPSGEDWSGRFRELDTQVAIRTVSGFELHCLTSPGGYELAAIRNTWIELVERLEDAGINVGACERFAISHDHPGLTPPEKCRYDACVAFADNDAKALSLATFAVPPGRYAVFTVEGPEASILGQYLEFYTVWMPQSGYEPDHFPVLEHYLPPFREGLIRVELWAKINRLALL